MPGAKYGLGIRQWWALAASGLKSCASRLRQSFKTWKERKSTHNQDFLTWRIFLVREKRFRVMNLSVLNAPDSLLLSGGAENIDTINLQQAETLYLSLPERSNDKHTLLILYTPTCSHCKGMEDQVCCFINQPTGMLWWFPVLTSYTVWQYHALLLRRFGCWPVGCPLRPTACHFRYSTAAPLLPVTLWRRCLECSLCLHSASSPSKAEHSTSTSEIMLILQEQIVLIWQQHITGLFSYSFCSIRINPRSSLNPPPHSITRSGEQVVTLNPSSSFSTWFVTRMKRSYGNFLLQRQW